MRRLLYAKSLAVRIGSTDIIRGLNLDIAIGDRVALMGPSGIGKSTLLRVLSGRMPVAAEVECKDCSGIPIARPHFLMYETPELAPWLSAIDNVALFAPYGAMSLKEHHAKARLALESVKLKGKDDMFPEALSHGMRRRVELARYLAYPSSVALLDDPLHGLDDGTRQICASAIRRVARQEGKSLLFTSNRFDDVIDLANRVIVLAGVPAQVQGQWDVSSASNRNEIRRLVSEILVEEASR